MAPRFHPEPRHADDMLKLATPVVKRKTTPGENPFCKSPLGPYTAKVPKKMTTDVIEKEIAAANAVQDSFTLTSSFDMAAEEEAGTPHDPDASTNVLPASKPPAKKITTGVKELLCLIVSLQVSLQISMYCLRVRHLQRK